MIDDMINQIAELHSFFFFKKISGRIIVSVDLVLMVS